LEIISLPLLYLVTPEIRITLTCGKCAECGHLLVIHWIRNMLAPGGEALHST